MAKMQDYKIYKHDLSAGYLILISTIEAASAAAAFTKFKKNSKYKAGKYLIISRKAYTAGTHY